MDSIYHCNHLVEEAGCFAFLWSVACVLTVMNLFALPLRIFSRLFALIVAFPGPNKYNQTCVKQAHWGKLKTCA